MRRSHLHSIDLTLPHLPAGLAGLRLGQVTDLHVRRGRRARRSGRQCEGLSPRHSRLVSLLGGMKLDLLLLTGDLMDEAGDEASAMAVLQAICQAVRPRRGIYGVFGNHDRDDFIAACRKLPIHWLRDEWARVDGLDLLIGGPHMTRDIGPDACVLALRRAAALNGIAGGAARPAEDRPLQIVLSHVPMMLPVVADLGVDVMLCGHTHGGQLRPLPGRVIYNSTDWPLRLTSGLLRHQNTLCAIARGLGEAGPPLRLFCPPQLPVYTLRRGPMPGRWTTGVDNLQWW